MAEILVVDDDQSVAGAFEQFLAYDGHVCLVASNAEDALRLVEERAPDLVVMDIRMPGVDGLQALQQIRERYPDIYVVMMTAFGTSQTSIDAIRSGAFDYLTKPLDLDQLRAVIGRALAARKARERAGDGEQEGAAPPPVQLIGESPAMHEVYKVIGRLATTDVPALIVGEHGTGRRLVAETIHRNSARRDQPFVTVECASSSEEAIAAEISGAAAGTIHLADLEALPSALQARLARTLAEPRFQGSRILASTDQDLRQQVEAGKFHRVLFETLTVITVRLPPLRERRDDIPLLVRYFILRMNEELNRAVRGVDDRLAQRLRDHAWPGNVRELARVIRRACVMTRSDVLSLEDVGDALDVNRPQADRGAVEGALARAARAALQERLVDAQGRTGGSIFHEIVDVVESTLAQEALAITNGNQVKAAEILGVNRATLRKKIP